MIQKLSAYRRMYAGFPERCSWCQNELDEIECVLSYYFGSLLVVLHSDCAKELGGIISIDAIAAINRDKRERSGDQS